MEHIYSRCSKDDQDTANQLHQLKQRYPDAEIHEEYISGTAEVKPVLRALIGRIQSGDTLIVSALDRIGRDSVEAGVTLKWLKKHKVKVVSLREAGLDYDTPIGKLMGSITLAVSEYEVEIIRARTKSALAAKKAEALETGNGWTCGRPKNTDSASLQLLIEYRQQGLRIKEIANLTGMSTATICRRLKAA